MRQRLAITENAPWIAVAVAVGAQINDGLFTTAQAHHDIDMLVLNQGLVITAAPGRRHIHFLKAGVQPDSPGQSNEHGREGQAVGALLTKSLRSRQGGMILIFDHVVVAKGIEKRLQPLLRRCRARRCRLHKVHHGGRQRHEGCTLGNRTVGQSFPL